MCRVQPHLIKKFGVQRGKLAKILDDFDNRHFCQKCYIEASVLFRCCRDIHHNDTQHDDAEHDSAEHNKNEW